MTLVRLSSKLLTYSINSSPSLGFNTLHLKPLLGFNTGHFTSRHFSTSLQRITNHVSTSAQVTPPHSSVSKHDMPSLGFSTNHLIPLLGFTACHNTARLQHNAGHSSASAQTTATLGYNSVISVTVYLPHPCDLSAPMPWTEPYSRIAEIWSIVIMSLVVLGLRVSFNSLIVTSKAGLVT